MTNPGTKSRNRLFGCVVAMALIVAAAPQVHAGGKAFALIDASNTFFFDATTGDVLSTADITIIAVQGAAQIISSRNGVAETDSVGDIAPPIQLDPAQVCVGPGCLVPENTFTQGDFDTDEYVRADSLATGTVGFEVGGNVTPSATQMVSETIMQSGGTGDASTRHDTFIALIPSRDLVLGFSTDITRILEARVDDNSSGAAASDVDVSAELFDTAINQQIALDTSTLQDSLVAVGPGSTEAISDSQTFTTIAALPLLAGNSYQFTLQWQTSAEVAVSAPSLCGNGIINSEEQCDDGDITSGNCDQCVLAE